VVGLAEGADQRLVAIIAVAEACHRDQLGQVGALAEAHRVAFSVGRLPPGLGRVGQQRDDPELLQFGEQHQAKHGPLAAEQGEMHGVLTGALESILGAVKKIEQHSLSGSTGMPAGH
jgi:hypothetical protein